MDWRLTGFGSDGLASSADLVEAVFRRSGVALGVRLATVTAVNIVARFHADGGSALSLLRHLPSCQSQVRCAGTHRTVGPSVAVFHEVRSTRYD